MDVALSVPDRVWVGVALVLGLVVGSFLNVVIHRLPRDESIVHPSSHCPSCQTPVRWYDNLPLLSYLWLRGRCRGCGARISLRYPVVELLTGAAVRGRRAALRPGADGARGLRVRGRARGDRGDRFRSPDHPRRDLARRARASRSSRCPRRAGSRGSRSAPRSRARSRARCSAAACSGSSASRTRASRSALGRRFEHWPGEGEPPPRFGSLDYWTWFPGVGFGDVKLLAMIGAVLGPFGVLETIVLASLVGLAVGLLVTRLAPHLEHARSGSPPRSRSARCSRCSRRIRSRGGRDALTCSRRAKRHPR